MIATPDVFPIRNPRRGFPLDCFLGLTDRSSLHYFGTRAQCIHDSDRVQKRTLDDGTFDLLNLEDRLLLTHVPRVQRAPEFAAVTPHRLTSLRILAIWGLTNGSDAVMIDCVHGANHLVVALTCASRVGRSDFWECLALVWWEMPFCRLSTCVGQRSRRRRDTVGCAYRIKALVRGSAG
jgi:hypothetical protein